MARTIAEIKAEIVTTWMGDPTVQEKYKYDAGETLAPTSVENILFYVMAVCLWTLEKLFDTHRQEVSDYITKMKPHTLTWYIEKAKAYLQGHSLVDGYDTYDPALTEQQINDARIIKYAAGSEYKSIVYIKVAKDENGSPAPLLENEIAGFTAYINEIRDAGVVVEIVSKPADNFLIQLDLYYDAKIMDGSGKRYSDETTPVQDVIRSFIASLPFNGEYRNASLVDVLQQIEGVVIPEIKQVQVKRDNALVWEDVNARTRPDSGYFTVADENLNINFIPYNGEYL